jgi:lipopolysaccharide export system permease protein
MSTMAWPWMNQQTEILKARFENRSTIARVAPGSFQESANGSRVFFVDKNSVDNKSQNVFISSSENNKQNMTSAKFGHIDNHDGEKFLILEQGQRVETSLLDNDIKLFEYKTYGTKVSSEEVIKKAVGPRSTLTIELIRQPTLPNLGELTWRFGIFIAAINYILMAVALTSPNPRLGRGGNFMMAILFFVFYNNMINVGQSWVSSGKVNWLTYLSALHMSVFLFATGILYFRRR